MNFPPPYQGPLFGPLAPLLSRLSPPWPSRPDTALLNTLAQQKHLVTARGLALRFVPPQADGLGYEARIATKGEVETRPDNWHDFFNGLVWCAFPAAKAALSGRHQDHLVSSLAPRGAVRDAMTHFDECGLVVLSADPSLLALLADFRWRELFWEARDRVRREMRWLVFGHATYEALFQPYRGLTAKAVLYEVPAATLAAVDRGELGEVDARLAADLAAGRYARPRELHPVPLLGIPGVTRASEAPEYYLDTWQFRPGRRSSGPSQV